MDHKDRNMWSGKLVPFQLDKLQVHMGCSMGLREHMVQHHKDQRPLDDHSKVHQNSSSNFEALHDDPCEDLRLLRLTLLPKL
jgi:hypothetical protein